MDIWTEKAFLWDLNLYIPGDSTLLSHKYPYFFLLPEKNWVCAKVLSCPLKWKGLATALLHPSDSTPGDTETFTFCLTVSQVCVLGVCVCVHIKNLCIATFSHFYPPILLSHLLSLPLNPFSIQVSPLLSSLLMYRHWA